ncbi:hypothetical protein ACFVIM_00755 [Streptomyces sp. NPDC057638]|uniref:hypothetical protein n=1 Tax=Streptomyces sp. NPDC057638 TaxID=3346190 RepID=UPI0036CE6704
MDINDLQLTVVLKVLYGRVRVAVEVERVMARLRESEGAVHASVEEEGALEILGALSIVDPRLVGRHPDRLSPAVVD